MRLAHRTLSLLSAFLVAISALSCGDSKDDSGPSRVSFEITVSRTGDGDYVANGVMPNAGGGNLVTYPGVTAFRANNKIGLFDFSVSEDGTKVTFRVHNYSPNGIDTLWARMGVTGASFSTKPDVVNGMGENVFVLGRLRGNGDIDFILEFAVENPAGYTFSVDFLDIKPRLAYSSDYANQGVGNLEEIFTLGMDFNDRYQVTRNSPGINAKPVWSPGGAWIAFERFSPVDCGGGVTTLLPQTYIVHPDGSNLTRVSTEAAISRDATFNPSGDLIAYDCRYECEGSGIDDTDICLYNIATGERKILFSGDGYYLNQIFSPRWSPDGETIVVSAKYPADKVLRWLYAPIDPLTGDTIAPADPATGDTIEIPVAFMSNAQGGLMSDGKFHRIQSFEFNWAPDSRHFAVRYQDRQWNGSWWPVVFRGVGVIDFNQFLGAASLPIAPETVRAADASDGPPTSPAFDPDGNLWFHSVTNSSLSDIQYVPLTDWLPPAGLERTIFISDKAYNQTPAPWPDSMEFFVQPP